MAKKILIVDDEPGIVIMIQMRLESANYDTITARDGQEALDKIEQGIPDLMVLDMNMPRLDGCALIKKLKASPKYKNIPIIMLTARSEVAIVKQCIDEGVDAYLIKPFKPGIFLGLVKGLLGE